MRTVKSCTLKIRGGADTYVKDDGRIGTAGKGALVQWERSGTLGVSQDQTLFVWKETEQDLPTRVTDGR